MRTHTHAHGRMQTAHFPAGPAAAAPVRTPTAVRQILGHTQIERKLQVGPVDDRFEREADRVADEVMRAPALSELSDASNATLRGNTLQHRTTDHSSLAAAPPIVHEVLRSPGQPLDAKTRAYFELRLGHDFNTVRVHTDPAASRSAEAVAAQAYTVGSDIIFGAGRYAPASRDGQRLLAHELAHVQQQSGLALQRQPLLGGPTQTIPTELRSSANIGQMTDMELADRHDRILKVLEVLGQFTTSTPDTDLLEREAARIGVELARRRALAAGRTFGEDSIKEMKKYFIQNAKKPEKPRENPPAQPPEGGWQDSCIVALNHAMKLVTAKPALPTTPETIEKAMKMIAASGHSGVAREVWFEGKGGRVSKTGALRPEKLQASIWDTVMSLAGGDPGWSVFTMSLLDGFHSVTLTLDANDPRAPRIYWSDQWESKKGWKEYTRAELDAEVTRLVQNWWDDEGPKGGRGHDTVVRVWRVSATAATSSGP